MEKDLWIDADAHIIIGKNELMVLDALIQQHNVNSERCEKENIEFDGKIKIPLTYLTIFTSIDKATLKKLIGENKPLCSEHKGYKLVEYYGKVEGGHTNHYKLNIDEIKRLNKDVKSKKFDVRRGRNEKHKFIVTMTLEELRNSLAEETLHRHIAEKKRKYNR
jgi:hypothetical protein